MMLIVLIWASYSCSNLPQNNDNFTVEVTVDNMGDGLLYLEQYGDGKMQIVDSAVMTEGKATFSGHLDFPEFYYITLKDQEGGSPFFADKGTNMVSINLLDQRNPTVTGSKAQQELDVFNTSIMTFDSLLNVLYQQYKEAKENNDTDLLAQLDEQYDALDSEKKDFMLQYAIENNSSVVSPYIIKANSYMFDLDELESVDTALDASIEGSQYTIWLKDRIAILKRVAVGQAFVDFTQNDSSGMPVTLSEVAKGKYLLVDFWASWCSPCRAENPNVVAAYQKFHDKGFDILGVSFDKNHEKWLEAIAADQLSWNHVSDLQGWGNAAGKLYGIQSIPQNILIDPQGIIIEKNLRGADLQEKLNELFN